MKVTAVRSEFKGKPVLQLTGGPEDKYPFTFGYSKAKRILACIKDIEAFVAEQDTLATQTQNKQGA